jgi:hypothetical protein
MGRCERQQTRRHSGCIECCVVGTPGATNGVALALAAFDDPLFVEANGKSVVDNTLVVIGTEYGSTTA